MQCFPKTLYGINSLPNTRPIFGKKGSKKGALHILQTRGREIVHSDIQQTNRFIHKIFGQSGKK